jgi:Bacterial extracellular solute-binding protein
MGFLFRRGGLSERENPENEALCIPLAVLLPGANVPAQKNCDIATVNNPAMIELQKLSTKFEADNPDIKLNWVVVEENILGQRVTTDVSTGSGQCDLVFIGLYETPIFAKRGWLKEIGNFPADYDTLFVHQVLPHQHRTFAIEGQRIQLSLVRQTVTNQFKHIVNDFVKISCAPGSVSPRTMQY